MRTLLQKKAFGKTMEVLEGKVPKMSKKAILLASGYAPSVARHPDQVFNSKSFQEMLAKIDDMKIVEKWYKWALSESDRRVSLEAGDKIMKLKNRYPKEQFDIELRAKRESLIEA